MRRCWQGTGISTTNPSSPRVAQMEQLGRGTSDNRGAPVFFVSFFLSSRFRIIMLKCRSSKFAILKLFAVTQRSVGQSCLEKVHRECAADGAAGFSCIFVLSLFALPVPCLRLCMPPFLCKSWGARVYCFLLRIYHLACRTRHDSVTQSQAAANTWPPFYAPNISFEFLCRNTLGSPPTLPRMLMSDLQANLNRM